MTPAEVSAVIVEQAREAAARCDRWLEHLDRRLDYEREFLAQAGYKEPAKTKSAKAALPLLNYGGAIAYRNPYQPGEIVRGEAVGMTKAEWSAIHADYKGTRVSECGTHRVRTTCRLPGSSGFRLVAVFLTDSQQHQRPTADAVAAKAAEEQAAAERRGELAAQRAAERAAAAAAAVPIVEAERAAAAPFKALAESLRAGVAVVAVPQLFPTPDHVAQRVADLAGIEPGHSVLEPSAGTGALLRALPNVRPGGFVVAVEINTALCERLHDIADERHAVDFLTWPNAFAFDRVVMNPPFRNGEDIRHVERALSMLKPGGRLVAIVAGGPRQERAFRDRASHWEELPAGTFAGTGVRSILCVLDGPAVRS